MPNQVITEFIGDPSHLFRTADEVERRLRQMQNPVAFAKSSPFTEAAKEVSRFGQTLQTASVNAATNIRNTEQAVERLAAKLRAIPDPPEPLVLRRARMAAALAPMTAEEARANDERVAQVREQIRSAREKREAAAEAARIKRRIDAESTALRQELRMQDVKRRVRLNLHAEQVRLRRSSHAQSIQLEQAETAAVVRESARRGAARRRSLLDSGGIPRRTGVSVLAMYGATTVGAPGVAQGVGAFEMARLAGLATASAATIGIAATALIAAKAASESIRQEAERRLKIEEQIAGAINKQVLDAEKAVRDLAEARRQAASDRQFGDFTSGFDPAALRRRRDTLEQLFTLNPTGEGAGRLQQQILALDTELARREKERTDQQNQSFADRFSQFQRQQQAEAEAAKKRIEDIEAAKKKVEELSAAWAQTYRSIQLQFNQDNPFVKVFFDADEALRQLRENLKGLPAEMQAAAIEMQRTVNARQLFGAQVDNRLAVFDLREIAARFRDDTAARRRFSQNLLDRDIAELDWRLDRGAIVNEEAIRANFGRRQRLIDARFPGDSPERQLDRQMRALQGLEPRDSAERAILDQRILNLASGLDPNDLRRDQRESIAQIAERAAEREERRFQEAQKIQQEQLNIQRSIDENQKRLIRIAERGGTRAVEQAVEITVRDETGAARIERRASPQDTADYYSGTLLTSGPGGLTNR